MSASSAPAANIANVVDDEMMRGLRPLPQWMYVNPRAQDQSPLRGGRRTKPQAAQAPISFSAAMDIEMKRVQQKRITRDRKQIFHGVYLDVVREFQARDRHLPTEEDWASFENCWKYAGAHKFSGFALDDPVVLDRMRTSIAKYFETHLDGSASTAEEMPPQQLPAVTAAVDRRKHHHKRSAPPAATDDGGATTPRVSDAPAPATTGPVNAAAEAETTAQPRVYRKRQRRPKPEDVIVLGNDTTTAPTGSTANIDATMTAVMNAIAEATAMTANVVDMANMAATAAGLNSTTAAAAAAAATTAATTAIPPHSATAAIAGASPEFDRALRAITVTRGIGNPIAASVLHNPPQPYLPHNTGQGRNPAVVRITGMEVPDAMTPEDIERMFQAKEALMEKECPVCMEKRPKTDFVRFSYDCDHEMCSGCVGNWVRINTVAAGARCPGCVVAVPKAVTISASSSSTTSADGGNGNSGKANIADPLIMFGKKLGDTFDNIAFASFQLPKLQQSLDEMQPDASTIAPQQKPEQEQQQLPPVPTWGRCPKCATVSTIGTNCLRQCMNPRCCCTFCVRCDGMVEGGKQIKQRHLVGGCVAVAAETRKIADGEGISRCTKCGTAMWHAIGHHCHHVKCPTCGHEQCHSCCRPYKHPDCKCPLFCKTGFKCRCARDCPECINGKGPCDHCGGSCPACIRRRVNGIRGNK